MAALSSALLVCMVVPWAACLLFFTALHWTFKEDRRRSLRRADDGQCRLLDGGRRRGASPPLTHAFAAAPTPAAEAVVESQPLVEIALRKRPDSVSRAPSG